MVRQHATVQDELRLDRIAEHLGLDSRYPDDDFRDEAIAACLARVEPIVRPLLPCNGEVLLGALASHFHVVFEEVRGDHDVTLLEKKYVDGKREIGFVQMRDALSEPGVDALLFERTRGRHTDPDHWVAILNLKQSAAKCYWNKGHELSHRIAEPSQGILPFRRHRFEAHNPVESLMDAITAEVAFHPAAFCPFVSRLAKAGQPLDFPTLDRLRLLFAPTASHLAVMKAAVKHWPRPVVALKAIVRGRMSNPAKDVALRVALESSSESAGAVRLSFFPNMRVPVSSPAYQAHKWRRDECGNENLRRDWPTSTGSKLANLDVFTAARSFGAFGTYVLVSAR